MGKWPWNAFLDGTWAEVDEWGHSRSMSWLKAGRGQKALQTMSKKNQNGIESHSDGTSGPPPSAAPPLALAGHAGAVGVRAHPPPPRSLGDPQHPPPCFLVAPAWVWDADFTTAFLQGTPVFLFLKWPIKRIFYSLWTSFPGTTKSSKGALSSVLFVPFLS